mmetsp:Transcript_85615/g.223450  ORF Transcript_85615/g.223450 Transcript_85615/m.223450 type:complete len:227 (+) Transcript_85615:1723-2403(+)
MVGHHLLQLLRGHGVQLRGAGREEIMDLPAGPEVRRPAPGLLLLLILDALLVEAVQRVHARGVYICLLRVLVRGLLVLAVALLHQVRARSKLRPMPCPPRLGPGVARVVPEVRLGRPHVVVLVLHQVALPGTQADATHVRHTLFYLPADRAIALAHLAVVPRGLPRALRAGFPLDLADNFLRRGWRVLPPQRLLQVEDGVDPLVGGCTVRGPPGRPSLCAGLRRCR